MKFFKKCKDGGPESTVTAYVLVEIKWLFSIMLLRFDDGSREAYHNHAFHAISWLLRGKLVERFKTFWTNITIDEYNIHIPSLRPIVTKRSTFHKVHSSGTSWALTFRGPWSKTWTEYTEQDGRYSTLTNGRKVIR